MAESLAPDFVSLRLSFGLGAGPMSLEESLGWYITRFRSSPYAMFLLIVAIFVDDGILAGVDKRVLLAAKILFFLLDLVGFACALPKLHFICSNPADVGDVFLPPQDTMLHLGCELSFDHGRLVVKCCRDERLSRVVSLCQRWLDDGTAASVTKRLVFRLAGAIAYDPIHLHALCSLLGDCLRRIVGKAYAQFGWDAQLSLMHLPNELLLAWLELLRWCLQQAQLTGACSHAIPAPFLNHQHVHLALYTDASSVGGGYVLYRLAPPDSDICAPKQYLLTQAAFAWRGGQHAWHSNRKELTVLLKGIRCAVGLMRNIIAMSPDKSLSICLDICSDNKPSVSWAHKAHGAFPQGVGRSSNVEKRSIIRLIDAVAEEFRILRSLGPAVTYHVRHCAGLDNPVADGLSRYLERTCDPAGKISLASALCDFAAVDKGALENTAEAVREADRLATDEDYLRLLSELDPCEEEEREVPLDEVLFISAQAEGEADDEVTDGLYLFERSLCHPLAKAVLDDCSERYVAKTMLDYMNDADDRILAINAAGTSASAASLCGDLLVSNDINMVYRSVAVLRAVLGFWRSLAAKRKKAAGQYNLRKTPQRRQVVSPAAQEEEEEAGKEEIASLAGGGYEEKDVLTIVRLSQEGVDYAAKGHSFIYDPATGVWFFRSGTITGYSLLRPCVPRSAERFRFLLALDAHRRAAHGGPTPTLSALNMDLHVPAASSEAKRISARCLLCAKLRLRNGALIRQAPLGGSCWDIEKMLLTGTPYSVCAVDFLHVFPGQLVFAVRCLATTHTTWLPVRQAAECAQAAIEGVRWLSSRCGKVMIVYCDAGTAFIANTFQDEMAKMGVKVEFHSARAPWETSIERSHRVGLRTMRACYTPHQLARASDMDLCEIYDHVTLLMNTAPICLHNADIQSGSAEAITADSLAFGYTRRTGLLLSHLQGTDGPELPDLHVDRPRAVQNVRGCYLKHHWQMLRDRSAKQVGQQPAKHRSPLPPGSAVLIRYSPKNKCDLGVQVGHIVSAEKSKDEFCRRYRVKSTSGHESLENHCNLGGVLQEDVMRALS
ncbi:hypothetical protein FOL47_008534 [Perkinsus chesapeaki]|uniref:Integrase catalytic domain-containing protein n=1 Tax=Perkinsus chesapeaki TaxID=330153 RepID=A0A7J6LDJ8_PERCH|nr:hypothetical protein FOL47_008534 [Perkinsus chesapeaki]